MKGFAALSQFLIVASNQLEDSTNLLQTKAEQRRDVDGEDCSTGRCKPDASIVVTPAPTTMTATITQTTTTTTTKVYCDTFECPVGFDAKPGRPFCVNDECNRGRCCSPSALCESFTCPAGFDDKTVDGKRPFCVDGTCNRARCCTVQPATTTTTTTTTANPVTCTPYNSFNWPIKGTFVTSAWLGRVTWESSAGRVGRAKLGRAASQNALIFKNNGHIVTLNWEKKVYKMKIKYSDADFNEGITFSTNGPDSKFALVHLGPTDRWTAPNQLTGSGNDNNQNRNDFSTIEITDAAGFNQLKMNHRKIGPSGTNALLNIEAC